MGDWQPSVDEVRALLIERSNWGRWGTDDQRGAVNLIDNHKRCEAAALVRSGQAISLSLDYPTQPAVNNPRPAQQYLKVIHQDHGRGLAVDYLGIEYHCPVATHIDALCHVWDSANGWNGRDPAEFVSIDGVSWAGIEQWRHGIVTRGVLLDIPAHRGVPYVTVDEPVTDAELRSVVEGQGVEIRPGDAVVVYSGRAAFEAEHGPWSGGVTQPGLAASSLWFLRDCDCAVLVWDMMDAIPQSPGFDMPEPVHAALYSFGLALVDNADLEPLARACAQESRYEFMLCVAPLPVVGGTGSPVNPIAVL